MQDGVYKTRIKAKAGLTRKERVFDYLMDTLWDNTEFWGIDGTEECYTNIGKWALDINNHLTPESFDLVVKIENDNVIEFWYIDARGTIKKVFN